MNSGLGKGVESVRRSDANEDPFCGHSELKKTTSKSLLHIRSDCFKIWRILFYILVLFGGEMSIPFGMSWSLIMRPSSTTLAIKLQRAAIACKQGPTGGQCRQAAPQADPDLTSGSRVLERGKSRSISKSIRLPRRYPSLAKLPNQKEKKRTNELLTMSLVEVGWARRCLFT